MTQTKSYNSTRFSFFGRFFSFSGRLNRMPFFVRSLVLWIISAVVIYLMQKKWLPFEIAVVIGLVMAMAHLSLNMRRLHDLKIKGWWAILVLLFSFLAITDLSKLNITLSVFINLVFYLYLLLFKGGLGYNKYGPDPLSTHDSRYDLLMRSYNDKNENFEDREFFDDDDITIK